MFKFRQRIYLDTAAATPLDSRVARVMKPFDRYYFGNPASIHQEGCLVTESINQTRQTIAGILGGRPLEITFTSGGTEANNLALKGVAAAYETKTGKPGQLIIPAIEHQSILAPAKQLANRGWDIFWLEVTSDGTVKPEKLKAALTEKTALVSIGYVNNEIGTIQPISDLAKVIRLWRQTHESSYPYFHTDACQAGRFLPLFTPALGVDLLTLNGGKLYGPKGIGLLWHNHQTAIEPLLAGGGQEQGRRSGTENVTGIIGLGAAMQLAQDSREQETETLVKLRDDLIDRVLTAIPDAKLHGPKPAGRVANNINLSFQSVSAELLVLRLDAAGIACSAGSACSTYGQDEAHVLRAIGVPNERVNSSIRFSLGRDTSRRDINYLVSVLPEAVELSRQVAIKQLSP